MAEQGSRVQETQYDRLREHVKQGADRMWHLRFHGNSNDAAESKANGTHVEPESRFEATSNMEDRKMADRGNYEDFPYDPSRPDPFVAELASIADDDDGVASPKSQSSVLSFDTMNSSVSGQSWTSTQRTIGGFGIREARAQDQLGPYKQPIREEVLGDIPADYQDYVNKKSSPTHDAAVISDAACLGRSSSTSSERSVPDSLYADLSSISNRDLQVPDGVLKGDDFDSEGSTSPTRASHIRDHISNLKLREPNH